MGFYEVVTIVLAVVILYGIKLMSSPKTAVLGNRLGALSMVPVSSTWMFAHNIYNFVAYLVKDGRVVLDPDDEIIASSLVTRDGKVVHAGALEAMRLIA